MTTVLKDVKEVLEIVNPQIIDTPTKTTHLGKYDINRCTPRPIKIPLGGERSVITCIKNANKLRSNSDFNK